MPPFIAFSLTPSIPQATGIIVGLFLLVFGLVASPCVMGVIDKSTASNANYFLMEFSRLVIAIQMMAAVINLPVRYFKKNWLSVTILVVPVMVFSWLSSALIIRLVLQISWPDSLIAGAMIAPTDPVLANSIIKGKFAEKRVRPHIRNVLSAESACNDATAAAIFALSVEIKNALTQGFQGGGISSFFINYFLKFILYELGVAAVFGAAVGYAARRALAASRRNEYIDSENFLSFAIALAAFIDGFSSWICVNDFIAVLVAGIVFSWDGTFANDTRQSHIQDVIDNLLNAIFFVFLGALTPWDRIFAPNVVGLHVAAALLVFCFRRLPALASIWRIIPALKSQKEALFVGHFGPIAVGTVFYLTLRRERDAQFPGTAVVYFIVISSIFVHGTTILLYKGASVAVRSISRANIMQASASAGVSSDAIVEFEETSLPGADSITCNLDKPDQTNETTLILEATVNTAGHHRAVREHDGSEIKFRD